MCRSKTLWDNNLGTYPVGKGFEREKPTRYVIFLGSGTGLEPASCSTSGLQSLLLVSD